MRTRISKVDERRAEQVASLCYDAALDPALWNDVVAAIARELDAERGVIAHARRPPASARYVLDGTSELIGRCPPGAVEDLLERARHSKSDFQRTELFVGWLQPNGLHQLLGGCIPLSDAELVAVGFYRSQRGAPFAWAERRLLGLVLPHLVRSLRIGIRLLRLERDRSAARAVLDELSVAVALLDEAGCVLDASRPMLDLADRRDGLRIAPDGLHASSAATTAKLRRLVARALSTSDPGGAALALERPSERRSLQALIAPVGPAAALGAWSWPARALILVTDPELTRTPPPDLLRSAYGLTDAEARVAIRLVRGAALAGIARDLGIHVATVRNHLKQVFHKTGTHRQAELVSLLHASPLRACRQRE